MMQQIRILAIDDEPDHTEQLVDLLDGKDIAGWKISVDSENDFSKGMERLQDREYDIVILDIYQGEPSEENDNLHGKRVLDEIKKAVPIAVILHTALPAHVEDLKSDIVRVVPKDDGGDIKAEVESLINGGVPLIKQKLITHVHKELTKYYWEFAENHPDLTKEVNQDHLFEHLITRRLALTLDEEGVSKIFGDGIGKDKVHPLSMYVFPPVEDRHEMGDILKKSDASYWVVLTPSCDLAHEGKSKTILLASCVALTDHDDYKKYLASKSGTTKSELGKLIRSAKDKSYFLPKIPMINMPDLVVDLQELLSVPLEGWSGYENIAKLDDPYAQDLLSKFTRLYNRPGSPDIDDVHILAYLDAAIESDANGTPEASE